ncbi:MAG: hypothetical protein ABIN57_10175 [Chitinophagaceae bacterium]
MSSGYLKNRNIEFLKQEIASLEKRKTISYAFRSTIFLVIIYFGITLFSNALFENKSVILAVQQFKFSWLLPFFLFWFAINYWWGRRSIRKRLAETKNELSKRQQELSVEKTAL